MKSGEAGGATTVDRWDTLDWTDEKGSGQQEEGRRQVRQLKKAELQGGPRAEGTEDNAGPKSSECRW